MHGVLEREITFSRGLEMRGSEIQKDIRIIEMWNAWLVKNEVGAIQSMPGDSALITVSGLSNQILSWLHGSNPGLGRIGFVMCSRDGTISYAYHDGTTYTGNLLGAISSADWLFAGIVRMGVPDPEDPGNHKHNFMIFQGDADPGTSRVGQITEIGSTTIDDIGVERPTVPVADIYLTKSDTAPNAVKRLVRYYISELEGGTESALSEKLQRFGELSWRLYFDGTQDQKVSWAHISSHDIDYTADNHSISFMFRADAAPGTRRNLLYKLSGGAGWSFHVGGQGKMNFEIVDQSANSHTVTSKDSVCDGRWHRIAVTYEFTGKTLELFKDGESQDSDTCSTLATATTNAVGLVLGPPGTGVWMEFNACDIRFYDDDVSADLVVSGSLYDYMHQGIPDVTVAPWTDAATTLSHYYDFTEGSGTTLEDEVGSADGTLDSGDEPEWKKVWNYGDASIDAEEGSQIQVNFEATRFHGNKYNIYRSLANGVVPFQVGTFTPTSTDFIFEDDVPDEDIGDAPFLHGDQPPLNTRPAVAFANRVYIAYRNRVYWTDIAHAESYWTDNIQGNWIDVYPEDGDEITALAADQSGILAFKTDHIYKIYGRSPVDFQVRPIAPSSSIPIALGAANINSVCETPSGIAFTWNKKVYLYQSESSILRISPPIEDELESTFGPSSNYYIAANMGYDAARDYLWLSIPIDSTGPVRSYLFDLQRGEWVGTRSRGYRSMQTIRAMEGAWGSDPFNEQVFAGAADGGGTLNDIVNIIDESAVNYDDDGTPTSYTSHFVLSPFWGRNRSTRKKFVYVDVTFVPTSTITDHFDVILWVDGKEASAKSVRIDMYDAATPDRKTVRVRVQETGRELTVKISNTPSTDGTYKILSLNYGYKEFESIQ